MNLLILGMPNVGKTSLYNLITNNDYNITHKTVGTTRDWHIANLKNNNGIKIYDTPGIIEEQVLEEKKIKNLITDINIFIYVLDF